MCNWMPSGLRVTAMNILAILHDVGQLFSFRCRSWLRDEIAFLALRAMSEGSVSTVNALIERW